MTAATIGIGVIAGYMVLPLFKKIVPATWAAQIDSMSGMGKARGLINVAVGVLLFSAMRQKRVKEVGLVIAGMGVYDLIAVNISALSLPPLPATMPLIDKTMPAAHGNYPVLTPPASGMAGSYGASAYDGIRVGASYERSAIKAFGDDLDSFGE